MGDLDLLRVFDNTNYSLMTKESTMPAHKSVDERLTELKNEFESTGIRTSIDLVALVGLHGHPHVLLLQPSSAYYLLPGGQIENDETPQQAANRILNELMTAENTAMDFPLAGLVAQYWRPNYEPAQYPYKLPHVSQHKEHRLIYAVQLPKSCQFHISNNFTIKAAPLMDLHDNKDTYGQILAGLPNGLSRFDVQVES
eukprot:TRINITY_DN9503_c0_g1_i3.p1 TRINITY_DN9503_c0_g1~~TRINITY_DN9503_c0_g1_i3.p1  ORF type:complete len:198 (+),score=26.81 TRINITY_DN9503_c0_g1_i3:80-673(+)